MIPVVSDMETRDPDDILTLCLIATHPRARLTAVTVNPGTPAQIGVVRGAAPAGAPAPPPAPARSSLSVPTRSGRCRC